MPVVTSENACDTLARRANQVAGEKGCQVTSNCSDLPSLRGATSIKPKSLGILEKLTKPALRPLKARPLPMGKIGGGFVRALQEEQEGCVRIRA